MGKITVKIILDLTSKKDLPLVNSNGVKLSKNIEIKPLILAFKKAYFQSLITKQGMYHLVDEVNENDEIFKRFDTNVIESIGTQSNIQKGLD